MPPILPDRPIPDPPPRGPKRVLWWIATAEPRFLLHAPPRGPHGRLFRASQSVVLAARRYREDHAGDRAAALAFTSLLSLVPILILALAVLGFIGVAPSRMEVIQRWLLSNLVPETAKGAEHMLRTTLEALRTVSTGLGIVGLIALVPVAWKLFATLDRTFQKIAGVSSLASRLRRLAGFWMTVALAPFLVVVSLLLTAVVEGLEGRGMMPGEDAILVFRYLIPLVPGWLGLIIAYRVCTGSRIRWRSAILGGTVAAVLVELLKATFALYLRHALVTRTVLSGMGVLPVFLLWVYLTWVVFLVGAELTLVADDYDATLRRSGLEPVSPP